ncbi:MAG TPA: heparan-alpha-glucosaminide N-acetyltransferase domain-containing protein [Vicinamibacterales bacterium]
MKFGAAAAARAAAGSDAVPGVQAHRVIFIDLARALAVVFMVYGHTISALLAPVYRSGPWFDAWLFQRGLTSTLFLLLSGFAFSIATTRHWATHMRVSPAVVRRLRRFALFIVLGYALHFPVGNVAALAGLAADRWRSFFAVDVLQLIGAMFVLIQALVMVSRSRRVFMAVSFVLAVLTIALTPTVWRYHWTDVLPLPLASYLSPANGSQFPFFPFAGAVLIGAAAGQLYARWGASHLAAFANRVLLGVGIGLTVAALYGRAAGVDVYGPGEGQGIPGEFMLRTGVSLVILGVIAHLSQRITRLPHVFGAVAQESLLIYFIHLCLVYGSVWNRGLVQRFGETLSPLQTLPFVLLIIGAMVLLAWGWNRLKHTAPHLARWAMGATFGAAMLLLLF